MAKASLGYREIIESIRKGNLAPVYILMGTEAYYIDLVVENLEKYAIPEEDRDFNYNVFYGNDADIDYVVGVAQQFPVFADRKLVILKEAQSMRQAKVALEKFAPYVNQPAPATIFVIVFKGDTLNATSKLMKAAKESGAVVLKSETPRDYELPALIRDFCQQRKVNIEDKAVTLLADYIGSPLSKLFGEVNKLISIVDKNNPRITCELIEKNIGISKEFNNIELVNAIRRRDYPAAVKIVKYFAANPKQNPTPMTTGILLKFFSEIITAHYLPNKSDAALIETFGLRSTRFLNDFKLAMQNFNPRQAVNAVHYLREFDTKSKGIDSYLNEYDLLLELIFKIFT